MDDIEDIVYAIAKLSRRLSPDSASEIARSVQRGIFRAFSDVGSGEKATDATPLPSDAQLIRLWAGWPIQSTSDPTEDLELWFGDSYGIVRFQSARGTEWTTCFCLHSQIQQRGIEDAYGCALLDEILPEGSWKRSNPALAILHGSIATAAQRAQALVRVIKERGESDG